MQHAWECKQPNNCGGRSNGYDAAKSCSYQPVSGCASDHGRTVAACDADGARVVREGETTCPRQPTLSVRKERFSPRDLLKRLYGIAQRTVTEHAPSHLIVAFARVNFEKPYTEYVEGFFT